MKKLVIIVLISMLIGSGFISGCNERSKSSKEKLIGIWKDYTYGESNQTWIFNENTFTISGSDLVHPYEIVNKNGKEFLLVYDWNYLDNTSEYLLMYWVDNTTLELKWEIEEIPQIVIYILKKV